MLVNLEEDAVVPAQVEKWLVQHGAGEPYITDWNQPVLLQQDSWSKAVHGSRLLSHLFAELSDGKEEYSESVHSVQLTQWLIKHKPQQLAEVRSTLEACSYVPALLQRPTNPRLRGAGSSWGAYQ